MRATTSERPDAGRGRSSSYASPSIIARRDRILREARKMIAKGGIATLSMDEVSRRAGVAKRTLYNAFQSKERLIAASIQRYFDDYASRISYSTEEATLERMLERLIVVARRNLAIRNYTRALMDVYFSHDVDPDIRDAIHRIAADAQEPLLDRLVRKRQLHSWVDREALSNQMVRLRYALAHAWAEGLISDDAFLLQLAQTFFTYLSGACCGAERKRIDALLKDLPNHPIFIAVDGDAAPDAAALPVRTAEGAPETTELSEA